MTTTTATAITMPTIKTIIAITTVVMNMRMINIKIKMTTKTTQKTINF